MLTSVVARVCSGDRHVLFVLVYHAGGAAIGAFRIPVHRTATGGV